jgi:DNA-binding NarL/FixJ family response regulator
LTQSSEAGTHVPQKIVLAESDPLILLGLERLLCLYKDFKVVATCLTGRTALTAILRHAPEMAVINMDIPDAGGLAVLTETIRHDVPTRVVLLIDSASHRHIFDAMSIGVHGLVLRTSAADTLVPCLRMVADGRRWLPQEIVGPAFDGEAERRKAEYLLLHDLTCRELEIVRLVGEGLPNKSIAHRLAVTEGTVKVHLHHIYQKLGVPNRTSLAALATTHLPRKS